MVILYVLLGLLVFVFTTSCLIILFQKWHWICSWDYNVNTEILTCSVCHRKMIKDGEYWGICAGATGKPATIWKEIK